MISTDADKAARLLEGALAPEIGRDAARDVGLDLTARQTELLGRWIMADRARKYREGCTDGARDAMRGAR